MRACGPTGFAALVVSYRRLSSLIGTCDHDLGTCRLLIISYGPQMAGSFHRQFPWIIHSLCTGIDLRVNQPTSLSHPIIDCGMRLRRGDTEGASSLHQPDSWSMGVAALLFSPASPTPAWWFPGLLKCAASRCSSFESILLDLPASPEEVKDLASLVIRFIRPRQPRGDGYHHAQACALAFGAC